MYSLCNPNKLIWKCSQPDMMINIDLRLKLFFKKKNEKTKKQKLVLEKIDKLILISKIDCEVNEKL